jgi:negative regulator of flagellin synthesis FlgM
MKINNIGRFQVNPYKKQMEAQHVEKTTKKDKVEISSEAKELLAENKISAEREQKVDAIKKQVQSGEYKVEPNTIAKKMIDFYSK